MYSKINISRIPRTAKSFVLALVFVIGIILLINIRDSSGFGGDGYFFRIFTVNSEKFVSPAIPENDPRICFKKYASETTSASSSIQIKATTLKKNISFFHVMSVFNEIMASLNIIVAIIEPSVLHCKLEAEHKDLLTRRNFNISDFAGSNTIITYGVMEDDIIRLQTEDSILKFRSANFQPYFLQASSAEWMVEDKKRSKSEKYTSHIFYSYFEWTVHIVVFQKRNDYLWHAGLQSYEAFNIPHEKDLLFAKYDSAYENFALIPLDNRTNFENFYIPSSAHYFLFQIPTSRFLECNLTRAETVQSVNNSETHSYLSEQEFNSRMLVALHELKSFFNPLLVHFWIFSGTMLGWYRQCDIIPYTSDVDFGAWVSEIDDLDYVIKYFLQNKNLGIKERMGVLEEALEFQLRSDGLRVDVFFMYNINNGSWSSGHRPSKGYYFRYYYPHFTLCSAELLRKKVQVPCETEDVIVAEYGRNWMKPVSSWGYETSIHNRGPNIYWSKERRPKVFQEF